MNLKTVLKIYKYHDRIKDKKNGGARGITHMLVAWGSDATSIS